MVIFDNDETNKKKSILTKTEITSKQEKKIQ